jgi:hypothetical protein
VKSLFKVLGETPFARRCRAVRGRSLGLRPSNDYERRVTSKSQGSKIRFSQMQALWEDGERVICRASGDEAGNDRRTFMVVVPAAENPTSIILDRLAHEYSFKDELDGTWAVRPLELVRDRGRTFLVLEFGPSRCGRVQTHES